MNSTHKDLETGPSITMPINFLAYKPGNTFDYGSDGAPNFEIDDPNTTYAIRYLHPAVKGWIGRYEKVPTHSYSRSFKIANNVTSLVEHLYASRSTSSNLKEGLFMLMTRMAAIYSDPNNFVGEWDVIKTEEDAAYILNRGVAATMVQLALIMNSLFSGVVQKEVYCNSCGKNILSNLVWPEAHKDQRRLFHRFYRTVIHGKCQDHFDEVYQATVNRECAERYRRGEYLLEGVGIIPIVNTARSGEGIRAAIADAIAEYERTGIYVKYDYDMHDVSDELIAADAKNRAYCLTTEAAIKEVEAPSELCQPKIEVEDGITICFPVTDPSPNTASIKSTLKLTIINTVHSRGSDQHSEVSSASYFFSFNMANKPIIVGLVFLVVAIFTMSSWAPGNECLDGSTVINRRAI